MNQFAALNGKCAMRRCNLDPLVGGDNFNLRKTFQAGKQGLMGDVNDGTTPVIDVSAGNMIFSENGGSQGKPIRLRFNFQRGAVRKAEGVEPLRFNPKTSGVFVSTQFLEGEKIRRKPPLKIMMGQSLSFFSHKKKRRRVPQGHWNPSRGEIAIQKD